LNFEFQFNFIKADTDIKIDPMRGIIPGKSSIDIEISYTPSKNITIIVEAEVTSNFSFHFKVISFII